MAANRSHRFADTLTATTLQASGASATDLRLWSSFVQLLALLGNHDEAIKVAEKALSMVQVRLATDVQNRKYYIQQMAEVLSPKRAPKRATYFVCVLNVAVVSLQALPEDKKPLSAELFWLTFRLHAGLPVSPCDGRADIASPSSKGGAVASLFRENDGTRNGGREVALLVLCSFAEGSFKRSKTKTKKSKVRLKSC